MSHPSAATDCMAYVLSSAAREKFKLLMLVGRGVPERKQRKEFRPSTRHEREEIKKKRKEGLSWSELAVYFDRSPYYCRRSCKQP